jgi:hypothetical protein
MEWLPVPYGDEGKIIKNPMVIDLLTRNLGGNEYHQ